MKGALDRARRSRTFPSARLNSLGQASCLPVIPARKVANQRQIRRCSTGCAALVDDFAVRQRLSQRLDRHLRNLGVDQFQPPQMFMALQQNQTLINDARLSQREDF